jgi:sulfate transport system permease protein
MTLQVEILYKDYNYAGACAEASLQSLLSLLTLIIKTILEFRYGDALSGSTGH